MDNILTINQDATADPASIQADNLALITSQQTAQNQDDNNATKQSGLGKFKDSQELLSAYSNLEKEFTKRSQKLKSLEAEVAKTKLSQDQTAENLIKRMVELNPELGEMISTAENLELTDGQGGLSGIESKLALALKGRILPKEREARLSYVDKIIDDDNLLKEKVLSKALDKLPGIMAPKLNKYRGQTIITPSNRPQNIAQAGRLAENILNNRSR